MSRVVCLLGGTFLGAVLGLGLVFLRLADPGECRSLDAALSVDGPVVAGLEGAYLPVGTQFTVVGADEIHEIRVSVSVRPGLPFRACADDRVRGLMGSTW